MTCSYCGTRNGESEHRCRRCGRRAGDRLTAEFTMPPTDGALAQLPSPETAAVETRPAPRLQPRTGPPSAQPVVHAASKRPMMQTSLFHESPAPKVVPIAAYAPLVLESPNPPVKAALKTAVK